MSSPSTRLYSSEFPEGYGDFSLISSDGMVFSISSTLLSDASLVFKDMLELGRKEVPELALAENSKTLEELLLYFEPLKKPLHINWDTIEGLLESARKYQVERVFKCWEREMKVSVGEEVKIINPLACLALACQFGRYEMARLALRELIRAPSNELYAPIKTAVDGRVMLQLLHLRQVRLQKMKDRLLGFKEHLNKGAGCKGDHPDILNGMLGVALELMNEPSWSTLERNMDAWRECDECTWSTDGMPPWTSSSDELFNSWRSQILADELELPELLRL
ncbi:hypothetical protein FRC17_007905 [Serendipita sp. 399]|nr:hypothetical protein FRC17_007905 [Serendipita sp. 399]